MVKDVWHKLEEGEFNKNGSLYEYIIEQNKNLPLDEKNMRVRIIKSYPKVKSVTTRYDPTIEVEGDADCYVPSYLGYNPKYLRSILSPIMIIFVSVYVILVLGFGIDLIKNMDITSIGKVTLPSFVPVGLSYLVKGLMIVWIIFVLTVPVLYHTIQRWKLYFRLKKEGLEYNQING